MCTTYYFQYGETETAYLKKKDKRLAEVIDKIGPIQRRVIPDLFSALVHSIVGQQITTKAQETIWKRLQERVGEVVPENILALPREELKQLGLSYRKTDYIIQAAQKVRAKDIDLERLKEMDDAEVCARLSALNGIGTWSAEMLMLFSMQRPDVLSFGDLAIHRGLRMLYHHRQIDRQRFERYRRRFSPYGSVASLYLWAIAGGAIPEMKDYAPVRR